MGSRIVFYGNCQMGRLAECFAKIRDYFPDHDDEYVYFDGEASGARERLAREKVDRLVYQVTRKQMEPSIAAETIRLPALYFRPLWPFDGPDERITATGPVTRGDKFVNRLRHEGLSADEIFRRYSGADLAKDFDLDRMIEKQLFRFYALDAASDVHVADWIGSDFRDRQLFNMFWHPTPETYSRYAGPICDFLGLSEPHADIACKIVAATAPQLPEIPIHPSVAAHFGLTWAPAGRTYQGFTDALTFDQWLWRHLTYEPVARAA